MSNRINITLLFIVGFLAIATVVTFPVLPISLHWGRLNIDRNLGSSIWQIPGMGTRSLDIRLGLDLRGGLQVVYNVDLSKVAAEDVEAAFEGVRAVIERRVNFFGVSEATVQTSKVGDQRRVIVELPGVTDVEQALSLIGQTAQLDFRLQNEDTSAEDPFIQTSLTGANLKRSSVQFDQVTGKAVVALQFNEEGAKTFGEITQKNIGKPLGIFLDNSLLTSPVIQTAITDGNAIISGDFTTEQAKSLSIQLNSGALPAPVTVQEQRVVGASLGEESVRLSVIAGLVGLALVVLFMAGNYGVLGWISSLALLGYTLLTLMVYKLIPVTLTLPGIAGFILSVGMAVDANILIFERLKEEIRAGVPRSHAMERAFGRAWDSIRDANVNTLIISFILFNPFNWGLLNSSGLVRGFALTLAIGIFLSLLTGVVVVRTLIRAFYLPLFAQGETKA